MGVRYIGVDVGGTSMKIGLFKITGELLDKWEVRTRREEGGRYILPDVARSIRDKMEKVSLNLKAGLAGIGLGVPGLVMPDGSVEVCVNLGWRWVDPQEELSSLLDGTTVKNGNNASVAALGEMWQGGGRGYEDSVMTILGAGVGGGVIINEKTIVDRHGLEGEINHIHVRDEEWEHCNCGGVGCVEQICSTTGTAREARRKMKVSDKPSVLRECGGNVTARNVLDAAKAGDELANEVMGVVGCCLGSVLSMAVMIVDLEVFVIGGSVSKIGQFLIGVIQRHYDYSIPILKYKRKLGLAALGDDIGIYGTIRLILQD